MNRIKRAYYYLFYKFYKMSESAPSRWLSDWKAGIIIIALEIWLLIGTIVYYNIFINRYFYLKKSDFIFIGLIVVVFNYYTFIHNDVWKVYIKEFESLPKEMNKKGSWAVFGLVMFVIMFVVLAFYLKFQINLDQYR